MTRHAPTAAASGSRKTAISACETSPSETHGDKSNQFAYALLPPQAQAPSAPPLHHWTLADGRLWATFHREASAYLVRFPGLADFGISVCGTMATCRPCPDLSTATREHLFLNQVHPLMLGQQGQLTFHASAVALTNRAIAFPAASGRGKSTIATALARAGASHLSDDGLLLQKHDERYLVQPGHPSFRLWDDSRTALLEGAVECAAPVSYTSKARVLSAGTIHHLDDPCPLSGAFFLGDGQSEDVVIERLAGSEAVAAWVAHAFILDPGDATQLERHFESVVSLVASVPAFRLDFPRRYDALDQVCEEVLRMIADLGDIS